MHPIDWIYILIFFCVFMWVVPRFTKERDYTYWIKNIKEGAKQRKNIQVKLEKVLSIQDYEQYVYSYLGDTSKAFNISGIACEMWDELQGASPKELSPDKFEAILNRNFGRKNIKREFKR